MDFEEFIKELSGCKGRIERILKAEESTRTYVYIPVGERFIKLTIENLNKDLK